MKRQYHTATILAGAALAGLISGGSVARATTTNLDTDKTHVSVPGTLADEKKGETHSCKGQNSCKGKGGCKTGDNGCAGKNSCKGKGGCATKNGEPAKV